ncbi:MetX [Methanococcoides methylutens]|uniref:Homoserine O-acetyltransferase n=1 Tax=Methanococcoides methylutens TaxID=2226 RepID=A0A099T362_METMT|nr:homoserine O-acetyltransferase [Methanococcoides methylutens]KGK99610.1 MetX [Methanococcoides methylutens]
MSERSVGIVGTNFHTIEGEFLLEGGQTLKDIRVAYETYGNLNKDKSNAILVCHALTGDAHAAGRHSSDDRKPGWWEDVIGPGKALDTDRYFVICSNVLGGCMGTTGPASLNPDTGNPYGITFPVITIGDMVNVQKELIDYLGIKILFAVVGGSMGGMQTLQWAVAHPDIVRKAVVIASTAVSSPQQIAFNEVGRNAIVSDPDWNEGDYYSGKSPVHGLATARMIAHITYLSDDSMHDKFGRKLQQGENYKFDMSHDFQVESYLKYQGETFTERFDANSYLYVTKAVDYFDLSKNGSLAEGMKDIKAKMLLISITSDWLYPPYQSKKVVEALLFNDHDVSYREIESSYGHDAFLLESGHINYVVHNFLTHTSVGDVMTEEVATIREGVSIETAAKVMFEEGLTHLPVVNEKGCLAGIVTSWDISKAVALKSVDLDDIMTKEVLVAMPDEPIIAGAKRMERHSISALPVVDEKKRLVGIIDSEDINRLIG